MLFLGILETKGSKDFPTNRSAKDSSANQLAKDFKDIQEDSTSVQDEASRGISTFRATKDFKDKDSELVDQTLTMESSADTVAE